MTARRLVPDLEGSAVGYGPVDEPRGMRLFSVRDPNGTVVDVVRHL